MASLLPELLADPLKSIGLEQAFARPALLSPRGAGETRKDAAEQLSCPAGEKTG